LADEDDTETRNRSLIAFAEPAHPPSRKAPILWAVAALLAWSIPVIAQAIWVSLAPRPAWPHVVAAVATAVLIALHLAVVPMWRYRVHRWEVSQEAVFTRTGWLVQERRIAPISRVQTVDTHRGPLDRIFGLANVTVTTASSAGAVRILALDVDVADRVVAQLTDIAALGAEDAT
jgi:membrane protein YdbS with pleckstrin-like domain